MALLTACIVRDDEERSYDPYHAVLGALLHDIGYAGTINKARGVSLDEMTDMEKLLFENHIQFGINYIENHTSSQTVRDIVAMHHEYLDGSGFPSHLMSGQIPRHARIVAVINEFVNQISTETQKFAPESLSRARDNMSVLTDSGKIDAEILDMLYRRLGGISELLASITSVLLS